MSSAIEIKLTGKGGQGVVSAGEILAHAAVLDGKEASAVAAYGSEARGGAVSSDVVIGDAEIPAPFVIKPAYVLAMSKEGYAAASKLVSPDTKIIYDSTTIPDAPRDRNHFPVPAAEIASSVGSPVAINMALLGAFAAIAAAVTRESIETVVRQKMKPEAAAASLKALEEGYEKGRGLLAKPPSSQ